VIFTEPGQEGQVDYGEGPMVRDPATGKYRRTRLFVFTLGHSHKSVRLLVFKSSSRAWAELHERAFRRPGGAPRVVVLDNLREGVIKADIYNPTINPLYADVLKHYGVVGLPCRVGDLLFQVVSRRYENKSLLLTTNLSFSAWPSVFPNASCAVALIDRIVHHCDVIAIEGDSYRRREAEADVKTRRRRPA
jgi:hypothetical protein